MTRRDFLKFTGITALNLFLMGSGGLGYSTLVEPGWLAVEQIALELPRLANPFSGFRLVQISDIHIGGWMNRERLRQVVEALLAQEPDLVVITGDFVIGHGWNDSLQSVLDEMVAELSVLTEGCTTLAVLGNHDYWTNADAVRAALHACRIVNISNDVYSLSRDAGQLHIAGVDDIWEGQDRLDLVLEKLPQAGAALLLAHEPDYADRSAKTGRFDLQLSGHSHGGQVVLPFIGPPILPYLGRKYPSGLYKVGGMWQYTNRGVGMARLKVRFNCRPEITVFTLESVKDVIAKALA
jgi:predicted MPP superfamily phosphohydrolase